MHQRRILMSIVFLSVSLFIVGCTAAPEKPQQKTDDKGVMTQRQVLNISETKPLDTIDISKATGFGKLANSTEGLYRQGESGSIDPGLASKTAISNNGRRYTFTIRKNARWSNGQAITAQDFVYSWKRTLHSETKSDYTDLFIGIKNAAAIAHHHMSVNRLGVKAQGKRTLVVNLEHPIIYFQSLMAYPLFAPQNAEIIKKSGSRFASTASNQVYSGPFKLINWKKGDQSRTLVPNPYYWDRKHVYLSKISIRTISSPSRSLSLYRDQKLDSVELIGRQIKNNFRRMDYTIRPYSMMMFLSYNFRNSTGSQRQLLNNKDFRLALSHAIDRKKLIYDGLQNVSLAPRGFVTTGLSREVKSGADFAGVQRASSTVTGSTKKAKTEWQNALNQLNRKSATIKIVVVNSQLNHLLATNLKEQLENNLPGLTIKFNFEPTTEAVTNTFKSGNADLMISGWGADFSDPISFLQIMSSRNPYNYGGWTNKEYDKLVLSAISNSDNDASQRWNTMLKADEILMKDQGVTPLYQQVHSYLVNPHLNGVVFNSTGVSADYKGAYFVK
ncbi:peptide ABC transporter substrate-binding protein [Secundilactobacillus malefermentans]|uniref:peptide ABC transporter substrate-binding protein n=1 Tax=Secundilactobacillus malefermentans TaxID=176292 RepID=UPI0011C7DFB4|nr:peptide ABC transporter substrate-binding protein [Secundilactobacillus malefermentans]QEA31230.1 peptide ABC transporter substrate-binding protein [Secundilactobacillus malefermentans]